MKNIFVLLGMFFILVLFMGCISQSIQENKTTTTPTPETIMPQVPAVINLTNPENATIHTPQFSVQPVQLPKKYWFSHSIGYFPNNYIVDYACTANNTTFETDYILITGSDGPHAVKYSLIPMEQDPGSVYGVPLPDTMRNISRDIVNTSIEPQEFTAQPNHIYVSHIVITTGPNLTGETIDVGSNAVAGINPMWSFLLNVDLDGKNLTGSNNVLSFGKYCLWDPSGMELYGRQATDVPDISFNQTSITLGSGQVRAVLISMQNYNGGVRRFDFKIDGSNNSIISSQSNSSDLLKPLPSGMIFYLTSPYLVEENFNEYSNLFRVSVDSSTLPGDYEIPIEVCYRDIDLKDLQSPYFPFSRNVSCPFETSLKIHVNY